MTEPRTPLSRRAALGTGALLASTLLPARSAVAAAPARALALTPQTTEGPYYLDLALERSDIRDGHAGVPLDLEFAVVDAAGRALPGLRVDVWHCDAQGRYSGFAGPDGKNDAGPAGAHFLRGSQRTVADGRVGFRTIYPGWYAGRTTHVHVKVIAGKVAVLTTQVFLPDALSEFLYTQLPAYRRTQLRDTLNSNDGIALEAGGSVAGAVREQRERYVAALTLVVDPEARPVVDRPPPPPADGRGLPPQPMGTDWPGHPGGPPGMPPLMRPALEGDRRVLALVPRTGG